MADANLTKLSDMINPQVMAAMVSAKLPKAIKFTGLANVDTTLVGQPGNTITMPYYKYIGDAVEFAEGEAINYAKLTTSSKQVTIKKAGIGIKLTDETMLSGYGDPRTEAVNQLAMSVGSKIDNDVLAALLAARLKVKAPLDLSLFDAIEDAFNTDSDERNYEDLSPVTGVLILNPKDVGVLRKAFTDNFTRATDLTDQVLVSGVLGQVFGWQILSSRKVTVGTQIAVKPNAVSIIMKRALMVETARDIDNKFTKVNADEHYGVALTDDTRALVVTNTVASSGLGH